MILLISLELIGWFLVAVFVVTQLIIPAWRGVKLFPAFGRRAKLEKEIIELNDEEEVSTLEREVESKRKKVEAVRNLRSVKTNGSEKMRGD